MIAPTTASGAAMRKAEKRYGIELGTWSFQRICQRPAAYDSISSTARGSADSSPRKVLIVTGKNVRYAASTATEIQSFTPLEPRPTTTIGAMARSGIVCEATT